MRKNQKNNGGHEKSSIAQKLEFLSDSLDSSPTNGEQPAIPANKSTSDTDNLEGKEKSDVPALPKEFFQKKTNWLNILSVIGGSIAVIIPIGGIIFWFAKLDSRVETTASDVAVIKPKVEQLIVNSEVQNVKLGNLENSLSVREKTSQRK